MKPYYIITSTVIIATASAATINTAQGYYELSILGSDAATTPSASSNDIGYNDGISSFLENNKGNVGGINSSVDGGSIMTPSANEFEISDIDLFTSSYRDTAPGNGTAAVATSAFSFEFTVAPTDTGSFNLNFDYFYEVFSGDNGSSISWSLTDSSNSTVADFTGTATTSTGSQSFSTNSPLAASTYTFEISIVHDISYNNGNNGNALNPNTISVSNLNASYTSIPEPSSIMLIAIGSLLFLRRRR